MASASITNGIFKFLTKETTKSEVSSFNEIPGPITKQSNFLTSSNIFGRAEIANVPSFV